MQQIVPAHLDLVCDTQHVITSQLDNSYVSHVINDWSWRASGQASSRRIPKPFHRIEGQHIH